MKIELNKDLDKEVYLTFNDAVFCGADFGKKICDFHPTITKENHSEYIDVFYKQNEREILETLAETQKCFSDIKEAVFSQLLDYFNFDYSNQDYTCYLSIFDCNPRYLETKTFQVFYKRSFAMRKEVIVHELTHFAFYDFCKTLDLKEDQALWELSEIFNVIFLNLEPIRSAIGEEELLFYPDLKEKLDAVRRIWDRKLSPKEFISESLDFLRSTQ
jgi:hypothetical protein